MNSGRDNTPANPPPQVILANRYHLDHQLASGGMATIWAGHDTTLDRSVALKVLHPNLITQPGFLTRFRREAVAAARLHHPNIVAIYDTVNGPPVEAIVMELVDGPSVRELLDEHNRLSPTDVVDLGMQVADALGAAHSLGIVHRDIKPANILIHPSGRTMVTDFGIAKVTEDADLTAAGALLGTAKYLAPEQVTGDEVDPRTDLFSLGAVLFEACTGRPPFEADTDVATALARLRQPAPRVRQFRPDIPRRLDELIDRCLQENPDDRPASAAEVRTELSGVTTSTGSEETLVVAAPTDLPTEPTTDVDDEVGFFESEQGWMLPALVVVVVVAALVVIGFLVSSSGVGRSVLDVINDPDDEPEPTRSTTSLTPISEIVELTPSAQAFDPLGDDTENDSLASRAVDGQLDTYWRTETYTSPIAAVKGGVGLLVRFEESAEIRRVSVEGRSEAWAAELYIGDNFGPDPATWGQPVTALRGGAEPLDLDLPGSVGSAALLWITDTGTVIDDEGASKLRFELSEIRLYAASTS